MTTRREALRSIGLGTLGLASSSCGLMNRRRTRPNVLLILADDMGWSDPGCFGGEIATPNLDRLAGDGLRFTRFHNTAKCFPSRACLLTGLYAQQVNMDREPGEFRNCTTLAQVLRKAGYRTLMSGKHHGTQNPLDLGFDRYYGLRDGCCNYFNPGRRRPGKGEPARKRDDRFWCIEDQILSPYTPEEQDFYTTDAFTDRALAYLAEDQHGDQPFFLYLAYTAPHDPLMAWPEDTARYLGRYRQGFAAVREARYRRQRADGLIDDRFSLSPATFGDWNVLDKAARDAADQTMAVYAAMIDRMDRNIGRVVRALEERGELENTLIIFASDNGSSSEMVTGGANIPGSGPIGSLTRWTSLGGDWANVSNTPFRYFKNYSHEGGICTPLIVHWPALLNRRGQVSHRIGHFIDVMPTLLEACGAEYPEEVDGRPIPPPEGESFVEVLKDIDRDVEGERFGDLFWQWSRGRAVYSDGWKAVSWGGEWQLYNLKVDSTETNDLAASHPDVINDLEARFLAWQRRMSAN